MITSGTVAADYRQITKVFAFRELRVIIIDNFGRLNGGGGINWCRPRIVRSDGCQYLQNAAVLGTFIKPRWTFGRITKAMQTKTDDLQRPCEGASVDQTTGFYRAFHMQTEAPSF